MNEFYIQFEVQVSKNGEKSVTPFVFDDLNAAYAKHYTILAAAAVSTIPYHASFIIGNTTGIIDSKIFYHRDEEETDS